MGAIGSRMYENKRVEIHNAIYTALGSKIIEYIENPDTVEVYINPDRYLWVNYLSLGRVCTQIIIDPKKTLLAIELISGMNKRIVHAQRPDLGVEAVLKNIKCRLQITLPPLVDNPCLMIRKHATTIFTLDDLVEQRVISFKQRDSIIQSIKKRMNILVVGATGSGKTTFTNALLAAISEFNPNHRLVILEDTPELQCKSLDIWPMVTMEHEDPLKCVTMNKLLFITMRLSPTRIIIGEVRDGAALTFLKALNTGHPGGICTTHADSALQGLERLEMLIQEANPNGDFRQLIAKAMNVVISLVYVENGKGGGIRKVNEIIQIQGWDRKHEQYLYEKWEE